MTIAVRLSHVEFDILWEQLGIGERPYPITVGMFGETMDERAELRAQAWRTLAERGLHDGAEPNPRLQDLLVMLVRNRFTIDGQVLAGEHLQVLAAARGEGGALFVQTDAEVRVEPIRGSGVVGAVIALVPDEKPGPGEPVTLPRAVFTEATQAYATGGYLAFETTLRTGGISGRDLRGLTTLVESARHGGGQLAANSLDRMGRRTRTSVLNWFDTDAGRYLAYPERRRDGTEWLTFAPGNSTRLARRLTELVTGLRV
ncbi:ESX secretion-associated protein EspG [Actinophytocola sp.]|uniref:ESX secretion-associated protein EspG n=1 Tax=Actinophytocola sp. TaxID=1872138 RepID=UPI002D801C79|nr:ESX secretion-associated protein EspG [Actinophytocola sp.]HET9142343.1 ESX secretion-associated protein EspG [Actinophytocola sp.]